MSRDVREWLATNCYARGDGFWEIHVPIFHPTERSTFLIEGDDRKDEYLKRAIWPARLHLADEKAGLNLLYLSMLSLFVSNGESWTSFAFLHIAIVLPIALMLLALRSVNSLRAWLVSVDVLGMSDMYPALTKEAEYKANARSNAPRFAVISGLSRLMLAAIVMIAAYSVLFAIGCATKPKFVLRLLDFWNLTTEQSGCVPSSNNSGGIRVIDVLVPSVFALCAVSMAIIKQRRDRRLRVNRTVVA